MRVLKLDRKKGYLKAVVEDYDDVWALSILIKPGDLVGMKTTRKIKMSFGERTESEKKPMFLKIKVSKVSFHGFTSALRVSGEIVEGPEDVKGSHTFSIEPGTVVEMWKDFSPEELDILQERKKKVPGFCIVLVDRDSALVVYRGEKVWIQSNMPPKGEDEGPALKTFFGNVKKVVDSFSPEVVIVAGPGFIKERLAEFLGSRFVDSVSSVSEAGVRELFSRGVVGRIVGSVREEEEERAVGRIYEAIAKGENVFYGENELKDAINGGNVKKVLVSASFISKKVKEGKYGEFRDLMEKVKYLNGKIMVVGLNKDAESRLDGLGGIAGFRRW